MKVVLPTFAKGSNSPLVRRLCFASTLVIINEAMLPASEPFGQRITKFLDVRREAIFEVVLPTSKEGSNSPLGKHVMLFKHTGNLERGNVARL